MIKNEERLIPKKIYYTIEQKLEILQHYADQHDGTIEDIQCEDAYIYEGVQYPVGSWIENLRKSNKQKYVEDYTWKPLSKDVVAKLDNLGMVWQIKFDFPFEKRIEVLKAYIADINIPYSDISNIEVHDKYEYNGFVYSIGTWVRNWRMAYNGDKNRVELLPEQIEVLKALGMDWNPYHSRFEDKIKIFKAYIADPNTSAKDISSITNTEKYTYQGVEYPIGSWIASFRADKRDGVLSAYREGCLKDLGMIWVVGHTLPFEFKVEVLEAYRKDKQGGKGTIGFICQPDMYVYKGEVYPIGAWVKALRKSYMGYGGYKKLDPVQVQVLENMGMIWDAKFLRRARKKYENQFKENTTKNK